MAEITLFKVLDKQQILECIGFAIWQRELPDDWDGEIQVSFIANTSSVEVKAIKSIVPAEDSSEEKIDKRKINILLN